MGYGKRAIEQLRAFYDGQIPRQAWVQGIEHVCDSPH
jgi:hypothetical protein